MNKIRKTIQMQPTKYLLLGLIFTFSVLAMPNLSGGIIENIVFSNKKYSCNIEIKGWVVKETQLQDVFMKMEDPTQLTYGELEGEYIYFLIRLENLQPYLAWGSLEVYSAGIGGVTVGIMGIEPQLSRPVYHTIPIGKAIFPQSKYQNQPTISFKWKKLYVQ